MRERERAFKRYEMKIFVNDITLKQNGIKFVALTFALLKNILSDRFWI
jgi:hypothetical protein